jgi:hypothetical protein
MNNQLHGCHIGHWRGLDVLNRLEGQVNMSYQTNSRGLIGCVLMFFENT